MADRRGYRNILVVEDDKDTVEIVARALSSMTWRVTMTLSMEDALPSFDHLTYDLVVTDIFMPGIGGIEGIQRMRALCPDLKILATSAGYSAMSSDAALSAAEKIGADAVLAKPFSIGELRDAVSSLLGDAQADES